MLDRRRKISRNVLALGFVSMLMDTSSEIIHSLLPVYLIINFGLSTISLGLIEGFVEAIAAFVKIYSGALSDWLGRRKLLAVIGYGLAALTKPIFPLADSVAFFVTAKFLDRFGKGIRGAPRDALIADSVAIEVRGASFGLRQSIDSIGAFLGPILAICLMILTHDNIQSVFWIATIPALISVIVLVLFVHEPSRKTQSVPVGFPLNWSELRQLKVSFWLIIFIATLFTLGRFSEAFLILKMKDSGVSLTMLPISLVVMNIAYFLTAFPVGILSDLYNRLKIFSFGILVLILADLILAASSNLWSILIGISLWGAHLGFTQGILVTLISDVAPHRLRGTAFGVYHFSTGLGLLFASLLAGAIWDFFGHEFMFYSASGISIIALLSISLLIRIFPGIGDIPKSSETSSA